MPNSKKNEEKFLGKKTIVLALPYFTDMFGSYYAIEIMKGVGKQRQAARKETARNLHHSNHQVEKGCHQQIFFVYRVRVMCVLPLNSLFFRHLNKQ